MIFKSSAIKNVEDCMRYYMPFGAKAKEKLSANY